MGEFAEEDKIQKETIEARNSLEGYAYSMKNTVNDDDKLGSKIDAKDKETIEEAVSEVIDWLEEHSEAEKDEYAEKLKEIEGICNPIVQKLYKEHGAPNQGGQGGQGGQEGKAGGGGKAGEKGKGGLVMMMMIMISQMITMNSSFRVIISIISIK